MGFGLREKQQEMKNMKKRKHLLAGALLASFGLAGGATATDYDFGFENIELYDVTGGGKVLVDPATYGTFDPAKNYAASFDVTLATSNLDANQVGIGGFALDLNLGSFTAISWTADTAENWFDNNDNGDVDNDLIAVSGTVNFNKQFTSATLGTAMISVDPATANASISFANLSAGTVDNNDFVAGKTAVSDTSELLIKFDAAVTAIPGDFDSDGDVDGADFLTWQAGFGTTTGATLATGDSDADGDVDGADFLTWQANFGTSAAVTTTIPEPASMLIISLGSLAMLRRK